MAFKVGDKVKVKHGIYHLDPFLYDKIHKVVGIGNQWYMYSTIETIGIAVQHGRILYFDSSYFEKLNPSFYLAEVDY